MNAFYVLPKDFFLIDTFAGTNATCTHTNFSTSKGSRNVKGQYALTYTCDSCKASRRFFLYAKSAKKGA